ncbi:MAG: DUF5916 domain-containing protein [Chitinophagales bacterium]
MNHLITKILLLSYCSFFTFLAKANTPTTARVDNDAKINYIQKAENAPKIDGVLDDEIWQELPAMTNFTAFEPEVGKKPSKRTEVKIAYDNSAMYVAAYMYDDKPEDIQRQLGLRDSWGNGNFAMLDINADYFGIFLDTYHDKQNAFGFVVTASDVQNDARFTIFNQDNSWNAVWYSKARIVEDGWIVEMAIPYGALRFSEKDVQNWGVGLIRQVRSLRERSMWSPFDPAENGLANQFGVLEGLKDIEPPLRLSVTPYVSTYYQRYTDTQNPEDNGSSGPTPRGGMDLKYGINESFTLDMVLIPDFGQVQSDDEVLNLSPFEVRYDENRPFFTEGTELFSKANLFYSRRVGGRPNGFYDVEDNLEEGETLVENMSEVPMYNATKLSGRTAKQLGIGFFNAVTGDAYATIENEAGEKYKVKTDDLTNYNIIVFDQALKNRSYVSVINTNVMRKGSGRDANVTGTEFRFANKKNTYAINGVANLSQVWDTENDEQPSVGYKYNVEIAKVSGNLQYGIWQNVESDTYDPNDLAYLYNNNEFSNGIFLRYNQYNPFWIFNNASAGINFNYQRLYSPNKFQEFGIWSYANGTLAKSFTSLGFNFHIIPVKGNDFFEPREDDRFSVSSQSFMLNTWVSTDYRKKIAIDANAAYRMNPLYNQKIYDWGISPRFRPNDKLFFIYDLYNLVFVKEVGYVHTIEHDDAENEVIYGVRERNTVVNTLEARYLFNSRMAVNLRARHYWSKAIYKDFKFLHTDGYVIDTDYTGEHNRNFNAFTLNLGYTWQFAPGSELSLVWKSDIFSSQDSDSDTDEYLEIAANNYFYNFSDTFNAPQNNTFSLKILYYIDYQMIKHKRFSF